MIHDFDNLRHPTAGVPSTRHIYRDAAGNPIVIANRYEKPSGEKFFLPYDVEREEWKAPASRPIYNLDKIATADPVKPIIFVEGEKCADALGNLGYLTTTTYGGSKADKKSDLSPLTGRNVRLCKTLRVPQNGGLREMGHCCRASLRVDSRGVYGILRGKQAIRCGCCD